MLKVAVLHIQILRASLVFENSNDRDPEGLERHTKCRVGR